MFLPYRVLKTRCQTNSKGVPDAGTLSNHSPDIPRGDCLAWTPATPTKALKQKVTPKWAYSGEGRMMKLDKECLGLVATKATGQGG